MTKASSPVKEAAALIGAVVETESLAYVRLAWRGGKIDLYRTRQGWIVARGPRPDLTRCGGGWTTVDPVRDRLHRTAVAAVASLSPAPRLREAAEKKRGRGPLCILTGMLLNRG